MGERFVIRPAIEEDWQLLRAVRLAALADSPDAFGATLSDAQHYVESGWRRWAKGLEGASQVFLAVEGKRAVGMVFASLTPDRAGLGALWVEPQARGSGLGEALLAAGEGWLQGLGVQRLQLSVTDGSPAERLYRRLGYERTGERLPMREEPPLFEVKMAKLVSTG